MPAVTVEDFSQLATIASPHASAQMRSIKSITTAPSGYEGEGFPVRRAFSGISVRELDPFIHMDQMGEVEYAPGEPKGTPWHPHRGFETVTYLIDGTFHHQDSHGGGGLITNGGTQWMTAGAGILHIEAPPEELVISGGLFHGIQLWVNLPAAEKFAAPAYQNLEPTMVRVATNRSADAIVRVIAGEVAGITGPGSTRTPINLVHATLQPGATLSLPWNPGFNALAYVLNGRGTAGEGEAPIETGQLVVHQSGDAMKFRASSTQDSHHRNLDLLLLGGRPINEPVFHYGPFVMNTRAEVVQALEDFQRGSFGQVPHT